MVNIIRKPGAEAAAKAVEEHFRGFGFATQYHPYTNSVELHGTYAQAERAGAFTYVAGGARTPYALSSQPRFPASFAGAVLATTFAPGPVMEPQFTPVINAPSTLPVHFGMPGLAPSDYGTLYGFNIFGQIGVNGAGRTVDILACFGYLHGATKGVNDDIRSSPAISGCRRRKTSPHSIRRVMARPHIAGSRCSTCPASTAPRSGSGLHRTAR